MYDVIYIHYDVININEPNGHLDRIKQFSTPHSSMTVQLRIASTDLPDGLDLSVNAEGANWPHSARLKLTQKLSCSSSILAPEL